MYKKEYKREVDNLASFILNVRCSNLPNMWWRGRCSWHMGPTCMIPEFVGSVLHLDKLSLGSDETVAAGDQHSVGGGISDFLSAASIIIGETED